MKNSEFINCLYPNKCAACDEIIGNGRVLCEYCSVFINNINYNDFCVKCGLPKEQCRCKYREYRFSGVIGVYKNEGIARKAYYSYKFSHREELAGFFAGKAAMAVKRLYGDLKFDAVVSVPTIMRSKLKRGFDHSRVIARKLAEILNIDYQDGILRVKPFRNMQHNHSLADRLENVRGKYYTVNKLKGKRILLFDDIYTSGATLDECAKELLFAGAREVYCVSILTTNLKKKNGEKSNGN